MARERTVVKGIVLRAVDTKESDRILTLLTAQGRLPVVAKGARSRRSRVTACTQLLAYGELTLSESRGWQYLTEGSTIELFQGVGAQGHGQPVLPSAALSAPDHAPRRIQQGLRRVRNAAVGAGVRQGLKAGRPHQPQFKGRLYQLLRPLEGPQGVEGVEQQR